MLKDMYNKYKTISAVIPAFNESPRLPSVIQTILKYKPVGEVIVVDDGSTDNTEEVVKSISEFNKKVKYIKHDKNMGKAQALYTGYISSSKKFPYILTIDGDLSYISLCSIDKLVQSVYSGKLDIAIMDLQSDRSTWIGKTNMQRLLGGQRFYNKKHATFLEKYKKSGYLIEMLSNKYCLDNNLKIGTIYTEQIYAPSQLTKYGEFKGFINYMFTTIKIIFLIGIFEIIRQQVLVEEDLTDKYRQDMKTKYGLGLRYILQVFFHSLKNANKLNKSLRSLHS